MKLTIILCTLIQVNKKRKDEQLAVMVDSPTKRGRNVKTAPGNASLAVLTKVCQHDKDHEYVTNGEKAYFTAKYYAKRPGCTRICFECKGEFGSAITISDKTPAYCCRNQFDKLNPCSHAYCHGCWLKYR
jgi:hypothetical protein